MRICAFLFQLPRYIELCNDEVWGVRKECALSIVKISCVCSLQIRRDVLAPLLAKLLNDDSRWVRVSAFEWLGPFISTFAEPVVTNVTYNDTGDLIVVNKDGGECK